MILDSDGNVEEESRYFTGFCADFDLCVDHEEDLRESTSGMTVRTPYSEFVTRRRLTSRYSQGTYPLMSFGLLLRAGEDIPRHCPLHDLESFIWVFLWVAVHRIRRERRIDDRFDRDHRATVNCLLNPDPEEVCPQKTSIFSRLVLGGRKVQQPYGPLWPLLRDLAKQALSLESDVEATHGRDIPLDIIEKAFADYASAFNTQIDSLPEDWSFATELRCR